MNDVLGYAMTKFSQSTITTDTRVDKGNMSHIVYTNTKYVIVITTVICTIEIPVFSWHESSGGRMASMIGIVTSDDGQLRSQSVDHESSTTCFVNSEVRKDIPGFIKLMRKTIDFASRRYMSLPFYLTETDIQLHNDTKIILCADAIKQIKMKTLELMDILESLHACVTSK